MALFSCSAIKKEQPPIQESKFADLMIELYANEGIFAGTYNLDSVSAGLLVARNEATLKKHGVSKQEFIATYAYYDVHKKELEKLYQVALDSITARRERLTKAK